MMNLDEFRGKFETYRNVVDKESKELRDSYSALEKLNARYQSFDAHERNLANQILSEWVLFNDEGLRFDAISLIDDFKILKALPALRELARRIATIHTPVAPFELQKVDRAIKELSRK